MVSKKYPPMQVTRKARERLHELADELNLTMGATAELISDISFKASDPYLVERMMYRTHVRDTDLVIAMSPESKARLAAIGEACNLPTSRPRVQNPAAQALDAVLVGLLLPAESDLETLLYAHKRDPLKELPSNGYIKIQPYVTPTAFRGVREIALRGYPRLKKVSFRAAIEMIGEARWRPEAGEPIRVTLGEKRYVHQVTLSVQAVSKYARLAERFELTKRAAYRNPGMLTGAALEAIGTGRISLNAVITDD